MAGEWTGFKQTENKTPQNKEKKEIVLKCLKRDQDKLLNPRTTPFTSLRNAYDSLLPYHLFLSPTYDDLIYQTVKRAPEEKNVNETIKLIGEILLRQENSFDELCVMEERLKVEEERYYLSKTLTYKNTKIKEIEETVLKEMNDKKIE